MWTGRWMLLVACCLMAALVASQQIKLHKYDFTMPIHAVGMNVDPEKLGIALKKDLEGLSKEFSKVLTDVMKEQIGKGETQPPPAP